MPYISEFAQIHANAVVIPTLLDFKEGVGALNVVKDEQIAAAAVGETVASGDIVYGLVTNAIADSAWLGLSQRRLKLRK